MDSTAQPQTETGAALITSMASQRLAIMRALETIQSALQAQEDAMRTFILKQEEVNQELEGNLRKSVKALAKVAQHAQDLESRLSKLESNTAWMSMEGEE
jgi:hypothetical protein